MASDSVHINVTRMVDIGSEDFQLAVRNAVGASNFATMDCPTAPTPRTSAGTSSSERVPSRGRRERDRSPMRSSKDHKYAPGQMSVNQISHDKQLAKLADKQGICRYWLQTRGCKHLENGKCSDVHPLSIQGVDMVKANICHRHGRGKPCPDRCTRLHMKCTDACKELRTRDKFDWSPFSAEVVEVIREPTPPRATTPTLLNTVNRLLQQAENPETDAEVMKDLFNPDSDHWNTAPVALTEQLTDTYCMLLEYALEEH